MENQTVKEGKTTAIISYITWIGTLIAFIMNNSKKNTFASFHIRQMIGLSILSLINGFVISPFLGVWASGAVGIALFVLWIIGFIGAIQGEEKKIPLLGDLFQDWFKGI
ncbi:hypothetical protein MHL31_05030 [Lutibacter sp. A80]|uniref:DUF4870 domain-containing protein n=1 Tax=Lutibacter sp. A80 TaxID=2918453 RepID=UPI001F065D6B|nr:hypothetical protein [Lutibacter sp. A80]UMB61570.1 hypothetical protein MHL31_05030 [Lutibacter sp. A80]